VSLKDVLPEAIPIPGRPRRMILRAITLNSEHEPPRLFGICYGEVYEEPSRPYLVLHIVAQRGKSGRHLLLEE